MFFVGVDVVRDLNSYSRCRSDRRELSLLVQDLGPYKGEFLF
jgi:hypothetical protein